MKKIVLSLGKIVIIISFIFAIVLWVKGLYPFGNDTFIFGDMSQMSITDNFYYLWDLYHGNNSWQISWTSGFGMSINGVVAEQGMLSPLNLFLLFFSRENLYQKATIMVVIKIIFCAISMYIYLLKYKELPDYIRITGGLVYSLSASSLYHYQLYFVLDSAWIFPLVMLGVSSVLKKKQVRWIILFLTTALIVNIYLGYMILVFVVVYSLLYTSLCIKERLEKRSIRCLISFSILISILLSSWVAIPALLSILKSGRAQNDGLFSLYKNAINAISKDNDEKRIMLIGLGTALAIIILYIIKNWKLSDKEDLFYRIISVLMLLSIWIPGIDMLLHGGSRNWWPTRYIWFVAFVLIDFAFWILALNKDKLFNDTKVKVWNVCLIGGVVIAVAFSMERIKALDPTPFWQGDIINEFTPKVICISLMVWIILYIWIFSRKNFSDIFIVFAVVFSLEMVSNCIIMLPSSSANTEYITTSEKIGIEYPQLKNLTYKTKDEEGTFVENYGMVVGSSSIANYLHVIDGRYQEIFKSLGYSYSWTKIMDCGGTLLSDIFINQKYLITKKTKDSLMFDKMGSINSDAGEVYNIYKYNYSLSFVKPLYGNTHEFGNNRQLFDNQNKIYQSITGENDDIIVDITDKLEDKAIIINEDYINNILYLYSDGWVDGLTVFIDDEEVISKENYFSSKNNGIWEIGIISPYANQVKIICDNDEDYARLHIGYLELDKIKLLSSNLDERVTIDGNNVEVQFYSNSDRVIMPILFDSSWHLMVNGHERDFDDSFGFISFFCDRGENDIKLRYKAEGTELGSLFTILGVVVLVIGIIIKRFNIYLYIEMITEYIYIIGAYSCLVLIFIIPIIMYVFVIV